MRQDKLLSITFAAIMFAGGLYCLLAPSLAIETVAMIVGLGLVFYGLGHLFSWISRMALGISDRWLLFSSIVALICGAIMWGSGMAHAAFAMLLVYASAAWLFLCGILSILHALGLRRIHVEYNTQNLCKRWPLLMAAGVLLIAIGTVFVVAPMEVLGGFTVLVGAGLMAGAISTLANVFSE